MRQATYLDFDLPTYKQRYERLQAALVDAGLDGVLLTTRDNVEYLTGFTTPSWRLGEGDGFYIHHRRIASSALFEVKLAVCLLF